MKRNPALVVFGNPARTRRSETQAWEDVKKLVRLLGRARGEMVGETLTVLDELADEMLAQVGDGIHTNPGRRASGGEVLSHSALALVYQHAEDGEFYVHGFGDREPTLIVNEKKRSFTLNGVPLDGSGVAVTVERDGSVRLHRPDGKQLWRNF